MASRKKGTRTGAFDVCAFLESADVPRRVVTYGQAKPIFRQGDAAASVMYIQAGRVKLSVLSKRGRQAVVAILGPGQFIGEDALTGAPLRLSTATAMETSTLLVVERDAMVRTLHERAELSDRFIAHLLAKNARVEADLVDQLFNSSEKRLARRCSCLPAMALRKVRTGSSRESRKWCSPRWWARRARASTSS
jgi:CRP/FNR family cyclic AMP-dependent transcriptional regulator